MLYKMNWIYVTPNIPRTLLLNAISFLGSSEKRITSCPVTRLKTRRVKNDTKSQHRLWTLLGGALCFHEIGNSFVHYVSIILSFL